MSVKIPPSPSAEEAPDYARRLREVRDLTQSKKPTRRKRRVISSNAANSKECEREKHPEVGNMVPLDSMRKPLATGASAFEPAREHVRAEDASFLNKADQIPRRKAHAEQPLADVIKSNVRFPRTAAAQTSRPNSPNVPSMPRTALTSAAVSAAVAVVVTFASQGIAAQAANTGGVIVAGLLSSLGV